MTVAVSGTRKLLQHLEQRIEILEAQVEQLRDVQIASHGAVIENAGAQLTDRRRIVGLEERSIETADTQLADHERIDGLEERVRTYPADDKRSS